MAAFKLGVTISAIDKITKPLAKINKSIEGVIKPVRLVQNSFRRLGRATRMPQLLRRARALNSSFGRLSSTFTSSLRKMSLAAGGVITTIGFLGRSVVGVSSDIEGFKTRLVSLTKSEELADKKFRAFSIFAKKSPFALPEIIEAGVVMESFGIKSDENLKKLGDLAAFMGVDIVFAARSLGRAFAGGAGAADVLRERGVLNLVKDFTELKFGVRDITKLSLPAFRKVLFATVGDPGGKIRGATAKLAKTFAGRVSMMGDAIFNLKKNIGDTLIPSLKRLIDESIIPAVKAMGNWVKINEKFIEQKFSDSLDEISKAIRGIAEDTDGLKLKFKSFFDGLKTGFRPLKSLIDGITSFSDKLNITSGGLEVLGVALSTLVSFKILGGISALALGLADIAAKFTLLWTALLGNPVVLIIGVITALGFAAHFLIKRWKLVSKFFADLWAAITHSFFTAISKIGNFLGNMLKDVKAWMDFMLGFDLFDIGTRLIGGFLDGMKSAWIGVTSFFSSSMDKLTSMIPDSFKEFFGVKSFAIIENKTITETSKNVLSTFPTFRKRESLPLQMIPSFADRGGQLPKQQLKGNIVIDFRNTPRGTRIVEKEIQGNTDVDIDTGMSFAY